MVTSTPPLVGSNGAIGFQPASQQTQSQQQSSNATASSAQNQLQQLQLLMMGLQQQQMRLPQQQNMFNQFGLKQFLITQLLQQRQQEHNAAMLNSPIPGDLSSISSSGFQTSTPLVNTDTSGSSQFSSFLSPQVPTQSAFGSSTNSTDSFQTPLASLSNTVGKPQRRRNRPGGPTVKTAEVWRFFKPKQSEQAATCDICQKTIKATNSSTTGMIRHLRSCHHDEYAQLEKARNHNTLLKTLTACTDEKSRENLLKALSANGGLFGQIAGHPSTRMADSSTASSVSPNSTASSLVDRSLLQGSSGIHSIDSFLVDSAIEEKASNPISEESAPPPASFTMPNKFIDSVKTNLTNMENKAKSAIESRNENLNEEEDEHDEDVENLHVIEEDSEEDTSMMSKPKRQKIESDKHFQEHQKISKGSGENIEKIIALMLLLDELSPDIVDQPGFRLLFANLAPSHVLSSAADFKSKIIPQVRSQLPNGDIAAYRQQLLENNRINRPSAPSTQWPISPSTTAESGYEEFVDVLSETASSTSLQLVENSIRSAQNISNSFGFSTQLTVKVKKVKENVKTESEPTILTPKKEQ